MRHLIAGILATGVLAGCIPEIPKTEDPDKPPTTVDERICRHSLNAPCPTTPPQDVPLVTVVLH